MKSPLYLLAIVLLASSCNPDNVEPKKEGVVEFVIDTESPIAGRVKSGPRHVLLSIVDAQGNAVETNISLQVFSFGAGYLSESVGLAPGSYDLVKFAVLDENFNAIFASPMEGSAHAVHVEDPLPIRFTITENGSTQVIPEVLLVEAGETPISFGYAAFGFKVVTPHSGTVTDVDGNTYHTVQIGNQVWMVENLKVTKYNDGTPIPFITDPVLWEDVTNGAYCWYDNNANFSNSNYGAIYNWYAVNTGKLAPAGWHVPTAAEWQALVAYAGGEATAGTKLKDLSWPFSTVSPTDDFGFSALPGGIRGNNGNFANMGVHAYFWNSDNVNSWGASAYYLQAAPPAYTMAFNKEMGLSVRCIKN